MRLIVTAIVAGVLVGGLWYGLSPSSPEAAHQPVTPPQTNPAVTPAAAPLSPWVNAVHPLPAAQPPRPETQPEPTGLAHPLAASPPPAGKRAPMTPGAPDLAQLALEARRQQLERQRLGLAEADQVVQSAQQHPDAEVRQAALAHLGQLETEYEVTQGRERRAGEPGQFVSAVAEHLPDEIHPAVLAASLDYLVEYGEADPSVRRSLDGLLQRPDIPPDIVARIYELLRERYGLSRDEALAQVYASPAVQSLGAEDGLELDEQLATLE